MDYAAQAVVWVVDDDLTIRNAMDVALGGSFLVRQAASGEDALGELIANHKAGRPEPDVVLLDIEMGAIDGYQTCRCLRGAGLGMPVIFVSSHDTLAERLSAFDAGGDEFISKPFDPDLVLLMVQRAVVRHAEAKRIVAENQLLQEKKEYLSGLHEVGNSDVLLRFLREAISVTDYESLSRILLRAANEHGVRAHIQIRHAAGAISLTPAGSPSPLELSILVHAATLGFRFRVGQRLILNSGQVSLLVLDLPRGKAEAERLDIEFEVLIESARTMAEMIEMRHESAARAETIMVASNETFCTVEELRQDYRKQQADTHRLLHEMIDGVEKSYVHLGLTDLQELTFSASIRHSAENILDLFELGVDFDRKFAAVLDSLRPRRSRTPEVWV